MSSGDQVNADPERIRELANSLAKFSGQVKELDSEVQRGLVRLGETFRDAEYEKFKNHFQKSRSGLTDFTVEIEGLIPKLRADADDLIDAANVQPDL